MEMVRAMAEGIILRERMKFEQNEMNTFSILIYLMY